MSAGVTTLGTSGLAHLIASTLSLGLSIACFTNDRWVKQDIEKDIIETVYNTKGLWTKCRVEQEMTFGCESYDKFWISLPSDILAGRFGVGISMFFHFTSIIMELLALSCNTFLKHNASSKRMNANIACICLFISMLSFSIGVCWYGAKVGIAYNIDMEAQRMGAQVGTTTGGLRYVYGSGLGLGWLNMVFQILLTVGLVAMVATLQAPGNQTGGLYDGMHQNDGMGGMGGGPGAMRYQPGQMNGYETEKLNFKDPLCNPGLCYKACTAGVALTETLICLVISNRLQERNSVVICAFLKNF